MARRRATHVMAVVTVEGAGSFPLDMLRYDGCVPDSQEDVSKLAGDGPDPEGRNWQRRQVTLRMYSPAGGKEEPTRARWESFGWRVIRTEAR